MTKPTPAQKRALSQRTFNRPVKSQKAQKDKRHPLEKETGMSLEEIRGMQARLREEFYARRATL